MAGLVYFYFNGVWNKKETRVAIPIFFLFVMGPTQIKGLELTETSLRLADFVI